MIFNKGICGMELRRAGSAFGAELAAFASRRVRLLAYSVFAIFTLSMLAALHEIGIQVFELNKSALVLHVFSVPAADAKTAGLLEEQLRALPGVRQVMVSSPKQSLERAAADPRLGLNPDWVLHKNTEIFMPWAFNVLLADWSEKAVKETADKILNLETGNAKMKAVSEVRYDPERWSLVVALRQTIRWVGASLALCALFLGTLAVRFFLGLGRSLQSGALLLQSETGKIMIRKWVVALAAGVLTGLAAHAVYFLVQALSYYPGTNTANRLGEHLGLQCALGVLLVFTAQPQTWLLSVEGEKGH